MAENVNTPFPPPNLPFSNPDGTPERNWYELLLNLFKRTGGTQPSSDVDDLLNLIYEMQAQAETQALSAQSALLLNALCAMSDALEQRAHAPDMSAITARLDDLERRTQESTDVTAILRRLDELENLSPVSFESSRYVERFIAGPTSLPTGVATTIHTLRNGAPAAWLVHAQFNFTANDTANYSAFAVIVSDGSAARIALSNNGALMTIGLSGLNVQVTQSSGGTQSVTLSISKVG